MKRILHLTIKKKWFDLIKSGKKKVEYREYKSYWISRLQTKFRMSRWFDEIHFRNGYQRDSPLLIVEYKGLVVNLRKNRFEIMLGRILN